MAVGLAMTVAALATTAVGRAVPLAALAAQAEDDQDAAVAGLATKDTERLGEIDRGHRRRAGPPGSGRRGDGVRPTACRRTAPPRRPKAREVQAPGPSSFPWPGPRTPPQGARRVTPPSGPSRNLRFYAAINNPSPARCANRRVAAEGMGAPPPTRSHAQRKRAWRAWARCDLPWSEHGGRLSSAMERGPNTPSPEAVKNRRISSAVYNWSSAASPPRTTFAARSTTTGSRPRTPTA